MHRKLHFQGEQHCRKTNICIQEKKSLLSYIGIFSFSCKVDWNVSCFSNLFYILVFQVTEIGKDVIGLRVSALQFR